MFVCLFGGGGVGVQKRGESVESEVRELALLREKVGLAGAILYIVFLTASWLRIPPGFATTRMRWRHHPSSWSESTVQDLLVPRTSPPKVQTPDARTQHSSSASRYSVCVCGVPHWPRTFPNPFSNRPRTSMLLVSQPAVRAGGCMTGAYCSNLASGFGARRSGAQVMLLSTDATAVRAIPSCAEAVEATPQFQTRTHAV